MTTHTAPDVDDVLQAFRLIDRRLVEKPALGSLRLLRDRLAGELIGDADRVGRALDPTFTLNTHAGGGITTNDRTALVETVRRQGQAQGGAMTWLRLDDLVVDGNVIAGQGTLRTSLTGTLAARQGWGHVNPTDRCITTIPLAFFIRLADLMVSEVLYLDVANTSRTVLGDGPDPHRCLALIDRAGTGLTTGGRA